MDLRDEALKVHREAKGKIEIISKSSVNNRHDLSILYTPGVAEPCKEIAKDKELVYEYTGKGNTIAIVTDGSAVLGLGDIGPEASLPVMEGKSLLFKEFGYVNAIPICVDSKNVDEIVNVVKMISPGIGGVNLEDISAPRCFEIERRLKEELDIPIFHDDQHGTAIVVHAGLINALKVVNKNLDECKIIINGSGAAGTAIAKQLLNSGAKNVIMCDLNGAISSDDENTFVSSHHEELSKITNPSLQKGSLSEIMVNSDVFIGVSKGNLVNKEMVSSMNEGSIIFAMANPNPEILPDEAKLGGVGVIATGRSDFPNQVNNLLAFPGVFKGALRARVKKITDEMKVKAAHAIASIITDPNADNIIPSPLNLEVAETVAKAIEEVSRES
jgi:malate dehydrogenase (oxaloacetate-decarboxylating)